MIGYRKRAVIVHTFVFLCCLLPLRAAAQGTVQAWRQVLGVDSGTQVPGGVSSDYARNLPAPMHATDVDVQGNVYVGWTRTVPGATFGSVAETSYLARYNAAGVQQYIIPLSHYVNDGSDGARIIAVYVSPLIAGQQYVYALTRSLPVENKVNVYKFTAAGRPVWTNPTLVDCSNYSTCSLQAVYLGADDQAYLAFQATSATVQSGLRMVTINGSRAVAADCEHPNITTFYTPENPYIYSGDLTPSAVKFEPVRHRWIAAGFDQTRMAQSSPTAVWGIFDPNTGAQDYGESLTPYMNTSNNSIYRFSYHVDVLPGGSISVITNTSQEPAANPSATPQLFHNLRLFGADNSVLWRYPHGNAAGYANNVASFGTASPIYVSGFPYASNPNEFVDYGQTPQWLEQLSWGGVPSFHLDNQPVYVMYPSPEGFYSFTYSKYPTSNPGTGYMQLLFNHFTGGVQDYPMVYADPDMNNVPPDPLGPGQFGGFATYSDVSNSYGYALVWIPHRVDNNGGPVNGQSPMLVLDRFATGLELNSLVAPASVQQNQSCTVKIGLNGPAKGGGYIVGLISNNSKLLMPNGTTAQNFTILAGQTSVTVSLKAGAVTANTNVRLTALQNNVRRYANVVITP